MTAIELTSTAPAPVARAEGRLVAAQAQTAEREASFRRLYTAYHAPLFAYARRRVAPDAANDLVAEVFTTAWRRLEVVPDEPATLPWLYGVARNVLATHRRSTMRWHRLQAKVQALPEVPVEPVDGGVLAEVEAREVLAALASLRPEDQEVLRLAAWEELGPSEIATVLGCSPNAAAIRLHRARKRLAAAFPSVPAPGAAPGAAGGAAGGDRRLVGGAR